MAIKYLIKLVTIVKTSKTSFPRVSGALVTKKTDFFSCSHEDAIILLVVSHRNT